MARHVTLWDSSRRLVAYVDRDLRESCEFYHSDCADEPQGRCAQDVAAELRRRDEHGDAVATAWVEG